MIVLATLVAGSTWWLTEGGATANSSTSLSSHLTEKAGTKNNQLYSQQGGGPGGLAGNTSANERAQRRLALQNQLALAQQTLASYQSGTKYPQESRPISEHPDQIYPNRPIEDSHAMRRTDGQIDSTVQIKTMQTRVYVASKETVAYSLQAVDSTGKTLPLFVTRAVARGLTFQGSRAAPQITLQFGDDGGNGDMVGGDGVFSTLLAPSATSLANFNGTIRLDVNYNVGDRAGQVLFDVIYSPDVPATWAGGVREVVEAGSLNLYLKTNVQQPGRYVVSGRIDDAQGKPFAMVQFNDILGQGNNEIRLTVFGKLIRDLSPSFPLTLRDVNAYLLKENTDPDRALMPRLAGTVHVTKTYSAKSFSDAEWQSEERSRYLTEYGKDVDLAKAALGQNNAQPSGQP